MSPLSADHVRIALCRDRVILARLRGSVRPRVLEEAVVPCATAGTPQWRNVVAALAQGLSERAWHGAHARVILSNHFVRYVLVPWSDAVKTDAEQQSYAAHCFSTAFGLQAEDCDARISEGGVGVPSVASSIDTGLAAAVEEAIVTAGLRLCSLQPYLMAAFNQCRRRLVGNACWFVLAEPGRICVARLVHGAFVSIRCQRAGRDLPAEVQWLIEREQYRAGPTTRDEPVFIYAPECEDTAWPQAAGLQRLPGPANGHFRDRSSAIALTG